MWVRETSRKGKKGGTLYRHESGWVVQHCGGFSAHHPWYLEHADHPAPVFTFNGMGWNHVANARAAVESIVKGELVVTDHRCDFGVLRVLSPTALDADVLKSGGLKGWR